MTRKGDVNFRPVVFLMPDDIIELECQHVPEEDDRTAVYFVPKRMSDRSKEQLNPQEVNLQYLLAAGVTIDPSKFVSSLGVTDVADLEAKKDAMSGEMLQYLMDHETEIKDFVKENNIR